MKNTKTLVKTRNSFLLLPTKVRLVALAVFLGFGAPAFGSERQVLRGLLPAAAARVAPVGRLPGSQRLNLAIGLPLRNQAVLSNLLRQLYDPASPDYQQYLTPEQFTERFGPTEQDYQALVAFARANGLAVTSIHPNRSLLSVSGSVADIERIFRVTLRSYPHPKEARTFFGPDSEPSLDLAVPVLHVSGLDNFLLPRPMSLRTRLPGSPTGSNPALGSGPNGTYLGNDFRAAYVPGVTLTGAGQSVGLVEFDGFYTNDITTYLSQAGLPGVPLKTVLLDGFDGSPGFANVEVALDIDMAICMAPGLSAVIIYEGFLPDDVLNRMATDNLAKQLSASWTYPIDSTTEQIFQQFAAQGQSFFNASGDSDAYYRTVDPPTDDPFITIVGGTTLMTTGPGGAWLSETVWNWGNGIGTGGGISSNYVIPVWQQGISMVANHGSTNTRNLPDVALTADNIHVVADNGSLLAIGGTSAAAPLWAGFVALVNEQAAANGKPAVGFINPAIYAIGKGPNLPSAFHDTTTGDNTSFFSPSNFFAVAGYDLCTGWGTPAGAALINALAPTQPLQILPGTGFTARGGVGGPFTVAAQNFTLTNTSTMPLSWALSNSAPWLSATPAGGTLAPGGPASIVTVTLNAAASNLPVGVYGATIHFTDINNGASQNRQFTLSVIKPPIITLQPANQSVLGGATAVFKVAVAGGLPLSYQWLDNGITVTDGGNISGAGSSMLVVSNVSPINSGLYTVLVRNDAGVVTSAPPALLTIIPSQPVIVLEPASQTALFGDPVELTVRALGDAPLFYQWRMNSSALTDDENISGSAASTLRIAAAAATSSGIYSVIVSNALGSTPSTGAVLTVYAPADVQLVQNGGFETGDFSFWNQFGNPFLTSVSGDGLYARSGNSGALLGPPGSLGFLSQILPTTPGGTYLLSLWLDNPDGLNPNEFRVTWDGDTLFDQGDIGAVGWTNLQFIVTAPGMNTTLELGFRDDNSFLGLDDISVKALLPPDGPPVITTQPPELTVAVAGATAALHAAAAGGMPLSYQWQFNGANILDATNSTLTLTAVAAGQAGNYNLTVSNALGVAFSSNGVLTVLAGALAQITFDDLPDSDLPIPAGYNGLIWDNFYYLDAVNQAPSPSGFRAGMVSASNIAFNAYGRAAAIRSPWPFALLSGYLTAAWNDNLRVEVKGYADGVLLYDKSYTLSATNPTLINFDFVGVTDVEFVPSGGSPHRGYGGFGGHFAMDNVSAVPNPKGQVSTLYSFSGLDGGYPAAALVQGKDGNFYGTTQYGGKYSAGSVFKMTSQGVVSTLISFNNANGASPLASLIQATDGNFYGTTSAGGMSGNGTVFRMAANGGLTTLVSFIYANGASPNANLVQDANGYFYGTTPAGGAGNYGTVFRMTAEGTLTTLVSFNDFNGARPQAGLIQGKDGSFYGTTSGGGSQDRYGRVFRMATNGALTTLVSFDYSTNGGYPSASLLQGADGSLYGSTQSGGTNGNGTIFQITANGVFTTLVSFDYSSGGYTVAPLIQATDGNFYGVTGNGGPQAQGTIFRMRTNGQLTTIFSFSGTNGGNPYAGLIEAADGNFYGLTSEGGTGFNGANYSGDGTIFRLGLNAAATRPSIVAQPANSSVPVSGTARFAVRAGGTPPLSYFWRRNGIGIPGANEPSYTLTNAQLADSGSQFSCIVSNATGSNSSSNALLSVLPPAASGSVFSFSGFDGGYPSAGLVQGADGFFYGTTEYGGASRFGTVFRMTANGIRNTLVSFNLANGAHPHGPLVQAIDGNFYGTTSSGGTDLAGTVFRVSTNGTLITLVSLHFATVYSPNAIMQADDGNFYGTSSYGGKFFAGTVFRVTPAGSLSILVSFDGAANGGYPRAGLVQGIDGNFYGTTSSGGLQGNGTVFKLTTNGSLTTLASFNNSVSGSSPSGKLTQAADGNFYGTTSFGGPNGGGTIFRITPSGTLFTLFSFNPSFGSLPYAGLLEGADGNFYGTTQYGGAGGNGIAFRITGEGMATNLYSFQGADGASSQAELMQAADGNVYGTTYYGGAGYDGFSSSGNGVIFRIAVPITIVPPMILAQPLSQTVPLGSPASFSLKAKGSLPLRYSWRRNGSPIVMGDQSGYTTNNVQLADSGSRFTCVISNPYGAVTSSVALLTVQAPTSELVQNGDFEIGDFTGWIKSGSTNKILIRTNSSFVRSGHYGAALGHVGSLGYLSQTIPTVPGQSYLLSFWLDYPNGATPNEFVAAWDGSVVFDQVNEGARGWINPQFFVTANTSNTLLQFGFRNDPSYLGLDDVRVIPLSLTFLPGGGFTHFDDGRFQFVMSGPTGLSYQVEVSTNLVNWTNLANITMSSPTRIFLDPTTNQPLRFYRLRFAP